MYKNLSAAALGISGRQSELIELALTFGFRGMELDLGDMVKRIRSRGLDHSTRFLVSAKIKIGAFDLPIKWQGDEATYRSRLVELREVAEIATKLDAHCCVAPVIPGSNDLPYHENFERHRGRLAEMGELLAGYHIKLGLALTATPEARQGFTYEFIHQAEELLTLIKNIGHPNVGLALNTWEWYVGGGGMDQLTELANDRIQIVSVRLANVPDSAELATITSSERILPDAEGQVDCAPIMRLLGQLNYQGAVTAFPHSSCFSGMTREAIVQKTAASLDEVWRRGGLSRAGRLEPATTATTASTATSAGTATNETT